MGSAMVMGAVLTSAQQRSAGAEKSVRFGDIILKNFATAELELGVMARVTGPSTTVDAVDADRKTTAQIRAQTITAYMAKPKSERPTRRELGIVERIEATGSVTFVGTMKSEADQPVEIRASGTKAVYEKTAALLTLTGPITFHAEQYDPSAQGKDIVEGKAGRATYDGGKRVLRLYGDVEATVVTPATPPEGSSFSGDEVTIDMSVQPYRVAISNPSLKGAINIKVLEPEKQQKPSEKGR